MEPTKNEGRMIELSRAFEIVFADPRISLTELRIFTEDHIGRLRSQNLTGDHAGQFTALLAAIEPLFAAYCDDLSVKHAATTERKGETLSKDAALAAFQILVRKREPRVADRFGSGSAQYLEFFPLGITQYNRATMQTAETLMDNMVTKAAKYVTQTGQDMLDEFTAARAAFVTARTTQVEQKGDVADAIRQRDTSRAALEVQLTKNWLTIALMFTGQPERCKDFFTQSMLEDPDRTPDEETPPAPPAP